MDAIPYEGTAARILRIVLSLLQKRVGPGSITLDQNLRDAGLTSLDMVNLMLAVEGEFDLFIPEPQMVPENFRSVAAIEALILDIRTAA
jgi:acyl carrier protein